MASCRRPEWRIVHNCHTPRDAGTWPRGHYTDSSWAMFLSKKRAPEGPDRPSKHHPNESARWNKKHDLGPFSHPTPRCAFRLLRSPWQGNSWTSQRGL